LQMYESVEGTIYQQLTLFAEDSRASRSAMRARDKVRWMIAGSGQSSIESFASLSRSGCWLRTYRDYCQLTLDGCSQEYSGTWPKAGMMRNGTAFQQPPLVRLISDGDCFWWPTPVANDAKNSVSYPGGFLKLLGAVRLFPTPMAADGSRGSKKYARGNPTLRGAVKMWPTPIASDGSGGPAYSKPPGRQGSFLLKEMMRAGPLNPNWVEWLMGFPIGWTDSEQ